MQRMIVLIEFTPFVNFLMNDNSAVAILTQPKPKVHIASVESMDPGRNVLRKQKFYNQAWELAADFRWGKKNVRPKK